MLEKISLYILPLLMLTIITYGMYKKIPIYEEFIEGAKDGFKISISIIPYLVALIVSISMFRASGALDWIATLFNGMLEKFSLTSDIIPLMFARPLSGSASLAIFSELATNYGTEAFITKLAAVMVGSSETTFYILTVYFGSVGIKKFRYALLAGILADITGIVLAILVSQYFFLPNIV